MPDEVTIDRAATYASILLHGTHVARTLPRHDCAACRRQCAVRAQRFVPIADCSGPFRCSFSTLKIVPPFSNSCFSLSFSSSFTPHFDDEMSPGRNGCLRPVLLQRREQLASELRVHARHYAKLGSTAQLAAGQDVHPVYRLPLLDRGAQGDGAGQFGRGGGVVQ